MQRIGPYEVLAELGRGGMGAVFRARRVDRPDAEVAVKVLLSPLADPEERARFEREARVLGGFRHPGIMPLLDAGVSAERLPYLVLPLMPGGSLHDRLRAQGVLEPQVAGAIALKLAGALEHAHQQGVLHRDLKPHNVLFDEAGEPVLGDFGLARLARSSERITATGEVLGTPGYMSPEQAHGHRAQIGPASDVYGLGATLYAMLGGGPPFRGGSALAVMSKVLSEAPDPLPREVDPELAAICFTCLAKDPHERYPDAAALRGALEVWLASSSAESTPRAERRAVLALAVAIVALCAGGLGVALMRVRSERDAAVPTPAPAPVVSEVVAVAGGASGAQVDTPEVVNVLMKRFLQAGRVSDWPRALALADEAMRHDRGVRPLMARARALWELGRRAEGLEALASAVALQPKSAKMWLTFAGMLKETNDDVGVLHKLYRAWRLDPSALGRATQETLVRGLFTEQRFADALAVIDQLLQVRPDDPDLRLKRCTTLWQLWKREEAIEGLTAFLRWVSPEHRLHAESRRILRWQREQVRESAARDTAPPRLMALIGRIRKAMSRRDWRAADALSQEALAIRRTPVVLKFASQCASVEGRAEPALTLAREAMAYSRGAKAAAQAAYTVAMAYVVSRSPRRTVRYLNQAIDLDPTIYQPVSYRARLRFGQGHLEEAFADFHRCLALEPEEPFALVGLGWEHYLAGRYAEALADHERALSRRPIGQADDAAVGRAAALFKLGGAPAPEALLDGVLKRIPTRFRARFLRAALRWARAEPEAALADQRAGLKAMPETHPERAAQERALRRMEAARSGR